MEKVKQKVATILLVDDDAFARQGLRLYLESLHYQVQEAADVQSAWNLIVSSPPQTAVIDIRLPLTNNHPPTPPTEPTGIALAQQIKKNYPTMSIVLLSAHEEYEREVIGLAQQYMRSIAFLHKGGDMGRLETALAEVQAGRTFFQQDVVNKYVLETAVRAHLQPDETIWIDAALTEFDQLSPREQEITHLLAASYDSDHIAQTLGLSKGSVDNTISRIYTRLGLTDMKTEATSLRPLPILIKACLLYDIQQST